MLDTIPHAEEMIRLLGRPLYDIWNALCAFIEEKYAMERLWNAGGRAWKYEYKYRRGGKTLCALYAGENRMGFMVVLGKNEREEFEADRASYSRKVQSAYDEAPTYHDGKWLMLEPTDTAEFEEYGKLLAVKRKPNRK